MLIYWPRPLHATSTRPQMNCFPQPLSIFLTLSLPCRTETEETTSIHYGLRGELVGIYDVKPLAVPHLRLLPLALALSRLPRYTFSRIRLCTSQQSSRPSLTLAHTRRWLRYGGM
jgi:hypothetical protein